MAIIWSNFISNNNITIIAVVHTMQNLKKTITSIKQFLTK